MRFGIGDTVRVGGSLGMIMTILSIENNGDMVLVNKGCTFYYHSGDCCLIPVKSYVQLSLFGGIVDD